MKTHWYRNVAWGDRRHWEVTIGRLNLSRWCSSAPCHLPGYEHSRHPLSVRLWRRLAWVNKADRLSRQQEVRP